MNLDHEIMELMQVFDPAESSFRKRHDHETPWEPKGDAEKTAFAALTSQKNRAALKTWYSERPSINPNADDFRQVLVRSIGEDLPLGK